MDAQKSTVMRFVWRKKLFTGSTRDSSVNSHIRQKQEKEGKKEYRKWGKGMLWRFLSFPMKLFSSCFSLLIQLFRLKHDHHPVKWSHWSWSWVNQCVNWCYPLEWVQNFRSEPPSLEIPILRQCSGHASSLSKALSVRLQPGVLSCPRLPVRGKDLK